MVDIFPKKPLFPYTENGKGEGGGGGWHPVRKQENKGSGVGRKKSRTCAKKFRTCKK